MSDFAGPPGSLESGVRLESSLLHQSPVFGEGTTMMSACQYMYLVLVPGLILKPLHAVMRDKSGKLRTVKRTPFLRNYQHFIPYSVLVPCTATVLIDTRSLPTSGWLRSRILHELCWPSVMNRRFGSLHTTLAKNRHILALAARGGV
jgi:hypothetical protein